jgi:hypothetical protein
MIHPGNEAPSEHQDVGKNILVNKWHKLFDVQRKKILVDKELQSLHFDLDNSGQLDNLYNLFDPQH